MVEMNERHATPHFVGDHLALDFLNSRVGPPNDATDWLADGAGLLDWLLQAGAIDPALALQFRADEDGFGPLDAVSEQARRLREWLGDFVERHAGHEIEPDAERELAPLNRLLARDDTYRIVEGAAGEPGEHARALRWREMRRWNAPERLLMPIAHAIGDRVCEADCRLIRACEGTGCVLVFYDRTKSHRRRWCSMALCGNRAKVAAFRARDRGPKAHAARRERGQR
jgi:predicted RNA-binding Zn ribbon-like protein